MKEVGEPRCFLCGKNYKEADNLITGSDGVYICGIVNKNFLEGTSYPILINSTVSKVYIKKLA